ncbi:MAG TPA: YraN family protein [Caulobacteraceae bacterium]|nr:YraN family protein [Caulobacteraceae bacterium]
MSEVRRLRGATARAAGRRSEILAALWLMAKGYRVLGFRHRLRQGEVDLLAARGRVLIAVEVKRRAALEAALEAVTPAQRQRLRRALRAYAARHPRFAEAELRLDLVALAPGRLPRHIRGAWREDES